MQTSSSWPAAESEGEMKAARFQELEDMAKRLLASVQERHDALEQIGKIRVQIAALQPIDSPPVREDRSRR